MEKSLHSKEYRLLLDLLRSERERVGLTQEDLAAQLDATQSFVSKCERGERRLDVVELRYWCEALGISLPGLLKKFDRAGQR